MELLHDPFMWTELIIFTGFEVHFLLANQQNRWQQTLQDGVDLFWSK